MNRSRPFRFCLSAQRPGAFGLCQTGSCCCCYTHKPKRGRAVGLSCSFRIHLSIYRSINRQMKKETASPNTRNHRSPYLFPIYFLAFLLAPPSASAATASKYASDSTGSGFMVRFPGFQPAGQTKRFDGFWVGGCWSGQRVEERNRESTEDLPSPCLSVKSMACRRRMVSSTSLPIPKSFTFEQIESILDWGYRLGKVRHHLNVTERPRAS